MVGGEGAAAALAAGGVAARPAARVGRRGSRVRRRRRGAVLEVEELGGDRHARRGRGVRRSLRGAANCYCSTYFLPISPPYSGVSQCTFLVVFVRWDFEGSILSEFCSQKLTDIFLFPSAAPSGEGKQSQSPYATDESIVRAASVSWRLVQSLSVIGFYEH